jgi:hypothetical protein
VVVTELDRMRSVVEKEEHGGDPEELDSREEFEIEEIRFGIISIR